MKLRHGLRVYGLPGSLVLVAAAAVAGCASVSVRKVPSPAHYAEWNDAKQAEADAIKGFRYYLPRPYVVVKKPFPVGGREFILSGAAKNGGSTVEIASANVPDELRAVFGLSTNDTVAALSAATMRVASEAPLRAQQADAGRAGAATEAPAARPLLDNPNVKGVTSNTATASILQISEQTATLTVTLAKGAPYTNIAKPTIKAVLIPIDSDGQPQVGKPVSFATRVTTEHATGSADGVYVADIRRADLTGAADYAAGLQFTGAQPPSTTAEPLLIYNSNAIFHVVGGAAPKPAAPAPKPESTNQAETQTMTKASVVTSGDPRTDPLSKLDAPFDILLLPDTDEQYAIHVSAGLGMAAAKMGLENGWMLETADTQVDNRELGKFIFEQIDKFTDIAAAAAKLAAGIPPVPGAAQERIQQADAAGDRVMLRVVVYEEAQPGLYPVLKSRETLTHQRFVYCKAPKDFADQSGYTYLPYRPYTVVAFNTIRRVTVEVLNPAKPNGDDDREASQLTIESDDEGMKTVTALLQGIRTTAPVNPRTLYDLLGEKLAKPLEPQLTVYLAGTSLIFKITPKADAEVDQETIRALNEAVGADYKKFSDAPDDNTNEMAQHWRKLLKLAWPPLGKNFIQAVRFERLVKG